MNFIVDKRLLHKLKVRKKPDVTLPVNIKPPFKLVLPFTVQEILCVAINVLFVAAVAYAAYLFTDPSSEWYTSLKKPLLMPPPIVFSVVWSILYVLMAASYSLYCLAGSRRKTVILMLLNGLLNPYWCYVFFTRHNLIGGIFVLIANIVVAIALIFEFYKNKPLSAYLFLPYILWLCFALVLNYQIALLN